MTSSHSNKVEIKNSAIESIDYIDGSLVITSGQPSSPPPAISKSGDTWTIDMECGRKGNSSVAGQFTNISGGVAHVYSPEAISDKSPDDLNFYFGVKVGIKISGNIYYVTLYLGQGHRGIRNNWWIGGQCVAYNSQAILVVLSPPAGDTQQVFMISGGISNLTLIPWFT